MEISHSQKEQESHKGPAFAAVVDGSIEARPPLPCREAMCLYILMLVSLYGGECGE